MNPTLVKVVGIIALITFIIGMVCAVLGLGFGIWLTCVSDDMYVENQDTPGAELLFGLIGMIGGGFVGIMGIVFGIIAAIYDALAHVPALIAYKIGKKNGNVTVYWLLNSLWLCLLFGTSIFILVF